MFILMTNPHEAVDENIISLINKYLRFMTVLVICKMWEYMQYVKMNNGMNI